MDESERITIRQWVEFLFKAHDREHAQTHGQLKLQADEYERRLGELNHAHANLEKDRERYVPGDVYRGTITDIRTQLQTQMEQINKALNSSDANAKDIARLNSTLQWLTRTVVGAVVLAIVAYLMSNVGKPIPMPGAG